MDDPGATPSRVTAAVCEATLNRGACGARERWSPAHRDLIAGMERKELRDVPVTGLRFVVVFGPLLNLAVLANGWRWDAVTGGAQLLSELRVDAENLACTQGLREKP